MAGQHRLPQHAGFLVGAGPVGRRLRREQHIGGGGRSLGTQQQLGGPPELPLLHQQRRQRPERGCVAAPQPLPQGLLCLPVATRLEVGPLDELRRRGDAGGGGIDETHRFVELPLQQPPLHQPLETPGPHLLGPGPFQYLATETDDLATIARLMGAGRRLVQILEPDIPAPVSIRPEAAHLIEGNPAG